MYLSDSLCEWKRFPQPYIHSRNENIRHGLVVLCTDGFYQSKDCIDSVIVENKLPSRIEYLEDDASCILIQLHNP